MNGRIVESALVIGGVGTGEAVHDVSRLGWLVTEDSGRGREKWSANLRPPSPVPQQASEPLGANMIAPSHRVVSVA